jgi:hypothetical protein
MISLATLAVERAESVPTQAAIAEALEMVNDLPASGTKDSLLMRIEVLEENINSQI